MRQSVALFGIALIVLVFIAGCTSDSGKESGIQATVPPTSLPPATLAAATLPPETAAPTTIPTPDPLGDKPNLMTIETITGVSGHQSVNVTVPYPSWEMWYTGDPIVTGGQDSHSASGSNSAVFPSLSIVVSDAATGTAIGTVEPPGGLDVSLWQRSGDPRPWSQKFYQGNKNYSFDITARSLKSYVIEVRVPKP